jgi:hypothetical protein
MEGCLKESGKVVKRMVKENFIGLMARSMMVSSKTMNVME